MLDNSDGDIKKWTCIYDELKEVEKTIYTKPNKETPAEFIARQNNIKHEKYLYLTDTYYLDIITKISLAKGNRKNKLFINFNRDDFKAGSKGLGFPNQFERSWLNDVVFNGNNIYTEKYYKDDSCLCEVLLDVSADVWNNGSFTTVFTW
tara:strand:- start:1804 stop:2250 length:447 start_codon:yes stop_codon:yes gene_type:complete